MYIFLLVRFRQLEIFFSKLIFEAKFHDSESNMDWNKTNSVLSWSKKKKNIPQSPLSDSSNKSWKVTRS